MTEPNFNISREMLARYRRSVTSRSYTIRVNDIDELYIDDYSTTGFDCNGEYFSSKINFTEFINR